MENMIDLNMSFTFSTEQLDGKALRNLVNMLYSRGPLLTAATGGRFGAARSLVHLLEQTAKSDNASDIVQALVAHDAVYGPGLTGVEITAESVTFTGFPEAPDVMTLRAYGQLAYLMLMRSAAANRIATRHIEILNVKYTFRSWLVDLGMNGDAFRDTRATLLAGITGNGSYRSDEGYARSLQRAKDERRAKGGKPRGQVTFEYVE